MFVILKERRVYMTSLSFLEVSVTRIDFQIQRKSVTPKTFSNYENYEITRNKPF